MDENKFNSENACVEYKLILNVVTGVFFKKYIKINADTKFIYLY